MLDPNEIVPIAIDGGHSNFYITGNYPDSDAGLIEMANRSGVRIVRLKQGELTTENLKDKKLLILTVPFVSFETSVGKFLYTDAEIQAIKEYADNGGNIIVTSKSDRGDPTDEGEQASVITNGILGAIGARARVAKAIVVDKDRGSNESFRITLGGETQEDQKVFNYDAMSRDELAKSLLKDVKQTTNNTFSAYNSAPILPNGTTSIVKGFSTTWGTDYNDLKGKDDKYAPKDDAKVVAEKGVKFTIEGLATSNASGYDQNTAFFDCIYVQDATGGVNVFPVSGNIQAGQTVRVTGYTSSYLGERQLAADRVQVIDSNVKKLPEPMKVTTKEASEGAHIGSLVKIAGTVVSFTNPNNVVETIMVRDDSGVATRVFIDGYITSDKVIENLEVGADITAVGKSSHDTLGSRIRISDRADIICTPDNSDNGNDDKGSGGSSSGSNSGSRTPQPTVPKDVKVFNEVIEITAEIKAKDGVAELAINSDEAKALFDSATKNNSKKIVIAPKVTGEASKISVTLPKEALKTAKLGSNVKIQVNVGEMGSMSISSEALNQIRNTNSGDIRFTMQTNKNRTIDINIAVNGVAISNVKGGINAVVPTANKSIGQVAVLVNADGSEKLITKSILTKEGMAVVLNGSATIKLVDNTRTFNDVPANSAMAEDTLFVSARGLFNGTGQGMFSPYDNMTRGMMVTVLHNLESNPASTAQYNFADVPAGAWFKDGLTWAAENKIVVGRGSGIYAPNDEVTRAELAAMIYNYAGVMNLDTSISGDLDSFSDRNEVAQWSTKCLSWAVGINLFSSPNGQLNPNDKVSRAEMASVYRHLVELIVEQ